MAATTKMSGSHREAHTKEQSRRELLAKYCYDLSKIVFATMVVGTFTAMFGEGDSLTDLWRFLIGGLATILLAMTANRTLTY